MADSQWLLNTKERSSFNQFKEFFDSGYIKMQT